MVSGARVYVCGFNTRRQDGPVLLRSSGTATKVAARWRLPLTRRNAGKLAGASCKLSPNLAHVPLQGKSLVFGAQILLEPWLWAARCSNNLLLHWLQGWQWIKTRGHAEMRRSWQTELASKRPICYTVPLPLALCSAAPNVTCCTLDGAGSQEHWRALGKSSIGVSTRWPLAVILVQITGGRRGGGAEQCRCRTVYIQDAKGCRPKQTSVKGAQAEHRITHAWCKWCQWCCSTWSITFSLVATQTSSWPILAAGDTSDGQKESAIPPSAQTHTQRKETVHSRLCNWVATAEPLWLLSVEFLVLWKWGQVLHFGEILTVTWVTKMQTEQSANIKRDKTKCTYTQNKLVCDVLEGRQAK